MNALLATASEFDGSLFDTIVPRAEYVALANRGWDGRWDASALDRATEQANAATADLEALLQAAQAQAASNVSGTTYEAVLDRLGGGFVGTVFDDADALCGEDVLACVSSVDPFVVHVDAADDAVPFANDFLRTGNMYHEFAHVLQFTNPGPTETAAAAFGGDWETMADCFALTYLDGWTLEQTIWTSSFEYWEVSLGYGYTCDEAQRQVMRDWYGALGYSPEPISQR